MRIENAAKIFSQTEEERVGWIAYLTNQTQEFPTSTPDEEIIGSLEETISELLGLENGDEIQILRDRSDSNRLIIVRHPITNSHSSRKMQK